MEKAQLPVFAELDLGDTGDFTAKAACTFAGTDNPRLLRAIDALRVGPLPREKLDHAAGCSNGPEVVAQLRRLGLGKHGLRCVMVAGRDSDGVAIRYGIYSFSNEAHYAVNAWLRLRSAKGKA